MDLNSVCMQGVLTNLNVIYNGNDESFYKGNIVIVRDSGTEDILPIIISGKLLNSIDINKFISLKGQLRSKDSIENDKLKVSLFVLVKEIENINSTTIDKNNKNLINIDGYVCKKPNLRTTPSGKQITDLLIACNYGKDKTAYLSCIAWGKNARLAGKLKVGDYISTQGKFQSRSYTKQLNNNIECKKIAYELSIDIIK